MKTKRLLILIVFLSCVGAAYARIMVPFPGVRELCKQADAVVIAKVDTAVYYDITKQKWTPRTKIYDPRYGSRAGFGMDYACSIVHVLKGTTETLQTRIIEVENYTESMFRGLTPMTNLGDIDRKVVKLGERLYDQDKKSTGAQQFHPYEGKYALVFMRHLANKGNARTIRWAYSIRSPCSAIVLSKKVALASLDRELPLQKLIANIVERESASQDIDIVRNAWNKRSSLISSIEFEFTRELLSDSYEYITPGDKERRRYIVKGENCFSRFPENLRAERYDGDGDLFMVQTSNGNLSYSFTYAKDSPGRSHKDQLIIDDGRGGHRHVAGTFIGPRAFSDAIYNVFFIEEMLTDEKTKVSYKNELVILEASFGPFLGKAFLDPEKGYALVRTELFREGGRRSETSVESFDVQNVDGNPIYLPTKASLKVYDIMKSNRPHAYTEQYTIHNIVLNQDYPDTDFVVKPRPFHQTIVLDNVRKQGR